MKALAPVRPRRTVEVCALICQVRRRPELSVASVKNGAGQWGGRAMSKLHGGDTYSPHGQFVCAMIPLAVMAMPYLSANAKLLFGRLALYADRKTACYPSLDGLAADLGCSVDAIGCCLNELKRRRRNPGEHSAARAETPSVNSLGRLAWGPR